MSRKLDIVCFMNTPPIDRSSRREALLRDLSSISTMQRGTLAEEYRERPSPSGKGTVRLGPYYKHQCWEDGRNLSRRVAAAEAPQLREDLVNGQRFEQLAEQLAQTNIIHTRALRAAQAQAAEHSESAASKKNSRRNALPKDTAKAKASLPRRARALPKKA